MNGATFRSKAIAALICSTVVVLAVLATTVTLAWHGTLNGEASSGILFAILTGVLGAGAHAAGAAKGSRDG